MGKSNGKIFGEMKNKIFVFDIGCYINEITGLFYPHEVTTLMFKTQGDVDKGGISYNNFPITHIRTIKIPKLGKGRFDNKIIINYVDYFFYTLVSIVMLPYLLIKFNKFVFYSPPFFSVLIIPLFRLFGKKVYIMSFDAQIPVALESKRITALRKLKLVVGKMMEDISIIFANKVFAVSKFLVDYYEGINKNVVHVPNGADVESISKIKPKRRFKEYTIAYLGGFEKFRGIDLLIDVFCNIRKDINAKLFLMGGGPDFERVKKYAAGNPDIVFTGFIKHDDAMGYIKGSDIVVMPSRNTISSQTISSIKCFEYVACEVPHIVTESGEHAYWTKKYETGLVVKDNIVEISKAILRLMNDKELYSKLIDNCKKHKKDIDYKKFKKVIIKEILR